MKGLTKLTLFQLIAIARELDAIKLIHRRERKSEYDFSYKVAYPTKDDVNAFDYRTALMYAIIRVLNQ